MFLTTILDEATEPYRQALERAFEHYFLRHFSESSSGLLLAHLVACTAIFVLYHWALGLLNLLQIYANRRGKKARKRFQIQPKQELLPSKADLLRLAPVVLQNQLLSVLEAMFFFWAFQTPWTLEIPKVPSCSEFLAQIAFCFLVGEFTFYYTHRLLHLRPLFRRIHHLHHQWRAPFGLTTFYCHPVEQLSANMLPMLLGPALLAHRCHPLTTYFWYVVVKSVAFYVHSGHAFLPGWLFPVDVARLHDLHHQKITGNYGTSGLLDWLHGTRIR